MSQLHRYRHLCIYFLLFAVGIFYLRILQFEFIWDDFNYIVNSPLLKDPEGLRKIWLTHEAADFWPVTYSLFWLTEKLFANSAFSLHALNLLLFLFSVYLIYKLLKESNYKFALAVAALYAFHPMNVELVAWAFQIKSNLAIVFGLFSILHWNRFLISERKINYAGALAFFILSLLAKVSLVLLPIIFMLLYFSKHNGQLKQTIKIVSPFLALAVLIGIINVWWGEGYGYRTPESEIPVPHDMLYRLILVGKTFAFYIAKILFPFPVNFVYPRFEIETTAALQYVPVVLLVTVLLWASVRFFKSRDSRSLLILIFLLLIFPVLGCLELSYMRYSFVADHWVGVAMLPVLMLVTAFLTIKDWRQYLLAKVTLGIFLMGSLIVSFVHTGDFANERKLFEASIQKNPDSLLLNVLLGQKEKDEGHFDAAITHYIKALEIYPTANSHNNLARIFFEQKKYELAEQNYLKSIELNPFVPVAYLNLGAMYASVGKPLKAIDILSLAVERGLGIKEIYYNLAVIYRRIDKAKAIENINRALALDPNFDSLLKMKAQIEAQP